MKSLARVGARGANQILQVHMRHGALFHRCLLDIARRLIDIEIEKVGYL